MTAPAGAQELLERFERVRERLRRALLSSGRREEEVRLLAVSKWQSLEDMLLVARHWRAGGSRPAFGESYVQEALAKQERLSVAAPEEGQDLDWHFIGHAQSNKARFLVGRFALIHTLDSLRLAQNLQRILEKTAAVSGVTVVQAVLAQVNLGLETGKSGLHPDETRHFMQELSGLPNIKAQGLMCLPPYAADPERSRPYFIRLRQMRDALEKDLGLSLPHLSMGMSHDFEVAVEEGADLVRVGTDIFGPRSKG